MYTFKLGKCWTYYYVWPIRAISYDIQAKKYSNKSRIMKIKITDIPMIQHRLYLYDRTIIYTN